jgi:hypothetical protein
MVHRDGGLGEKEETTVIGLVHDLVVIIQRGSKA